MKISIITVCYNSAKTIASTLESITTQNYNNIEHIIIDGASKDDTLKIIDQYKSKDTVVISEPDGGIYDAMNKGIKLASGDVIGTLNADDFYIDDDVISTVAKAFSEGSIDASYSDLIYVDQVDTNKTVRYWKSQPYKDGLFKQGWMPAHPTFFVRKAVYDRLGSFDLSYKIAADFELLFRFIEKNKINTTYIAKVLVKMRTGGTTNKNLSNIVTQNKEIINTLKKQYPDFSLVTFILKKLSNRALQFLKQPTVTK